MSARDLQVFVVVDESIDDASTEELQVILDQAGINATIEPTYNDGHAVSAAYSGSRRKAFRTDTAGMFKHEPVWTIILFAPVNELVKRLGVSATKDLVGKLWTARVKQTGSRGNEGLVMLVDEETGIRSVLERDMPDDAFDILTDIDFRAFRSDPLQFYRDRGRHGRWRSPDNVSGTG
jgi:hypothetical protein